MSKHVLRFSIAWMLVAIASGSVQAADHEVKLAGGKVKMNATEKWVKKKPRVRIIEFEFAVPKAKDDPADGRITVMGAGGSVEANIARWKSQFPKRETEKVEDKKVGGNKVTTVDVSGTFKDQRGPFAPATLREDYRMLAAIIQTESLGQYFVKFTGPAKTVKENEKAFGDLIESLEVKK